MAEKKQAAQHGEDKLDLKIWNNLLAPADRPLGNPYGPMMFCVECGSFVPTLQGRTTGVLTCYWCGNNWP